MSETLKIRRTAVIAGIFTLLLAGIYFSLTSGTAELSATQVWQALNVGGASSDRMIVWELRLPRLLIGILVGANLAVAGALLQGVMQNPLAAPNVIGISAGAGLGGVLVLLSLSSRSDAYGLPIPPMFLLPFAAFVGAALTAGAIYLLAWRVGVSPIRLALAGIALGTVIRAVILGIVLTWGSTRLQGVLVWLTGSLWARGWREFAMLWPWALSGLVLSLCVSRQVNLLLLGEDLAKGLGLRIQTARLVITGISVLLAASATAVAGPIGFIGLVVPHATRRLIASTDYRMVLPVAALLGATLLVHADLAGRLLFSPRDFPAGIVTSLVGVPFFIYLLRKEG